MTRELSLLGATVLAVTVDLKDGTIQPGEPAIIAVSGARLPFRFSEGPVPSIVRAVCAVGNLVLEIDRLTMIACVLGNSSDQQAGPKLCLEPGRFPTGPGRVGWSGLVGLISRYRGLGSWLCGVGAI